MALDNPLFNRSYGRLLGNEVSSSTSAAAFFQSFYEHFLRHEQVRELFVGVDINKQVTMLKASFYHLVGASVLDEPSAEIQRLAALHQRLGISLGLFDAWLAALIDTVAENDPLFDEATGLAWCWALTPGITMMKVEMVAARTCQG